MEKKNKLFEEFVKENLKGYIENLNTYNFLNDVELGDANFSAYEKKDTNRFFGRDIPWLDPDAWSNNLYLCHEFFLNCFQKDFIVKKTEDYDGSKILKAYELRLSSDYIGPSDAYALQAGIDKQEICNFLSKTRTFGGHILFPKHTSSINQRRASLFTDRIDLALEDIQRHYSKTEDSRLVVGVDIDWFNKFSSFENFVDFFYLQDFMEDKKSDAGTYKVKELAPFEDIGKNHSTMPVSFQAFIDNNVKAIEERNKRIIEALRKDL